jgi:hypothetical protein
MYIQFRSLPPRKYSLICKSVIKSNQKDITTAYFKLLTSGSLTPWIQLCISHGRRPRRRRRHHHHHHRFMSYGCYSLTSWNPHPSSSHNQSCMGKSQLDLRIWLVKYFPTGCTCHFLHPWIAPAPRRHSAICIMRFVSVLGDQDRRTGGFNEQIWEFTTNQSMVIWIILIQYHD